MRSSKWVRLASSMALAVSLFAGMAVSAQEVTQEPTEDMMMSHMMMQEGACPEGWAATMLDDWRNTAEMGTSMMPTAEATFDLTGDTVPPEATMQAPMEATEDMGMTGTEEALGVKCLFGEFSGAAEVPGPGDDDAAGFAFVSVDPASGDICYEVAVANITLPAAAMHIHVNSAGVSGDVVVPFPTAPDALGNASGCTNASTEGLAEAIATTPEQYYVNVHTSDFPSGAARAQLSSWDDARMNMDMNDDTMATQDASMGEMSTPEATTSG